MKELKNDWIDGVVAGIVLSCDVLASMEHGDLMMQIISETGIVASKIIKEIKRNGLPKTKEILKKEMSSGKWKQE